MTNVLFMLRAPLAAAMQDELIETNPLYAEVAGPGSAGEPPVRVANQMGHTSLKMIEQRYGRWIKDTAPNAGDKAVKLFGGFDGNAGSNAGFG